MDEFLTELRKYPKVRDENFQADPVASEMQMITLSNNRSNNKSSHITNAFTKNNSENNNTPSSIPVEEVKETQGDFFEECLRPLLLRHLEQKDADAVVRQFKIEHQKYIDSLSLDDIERLCSQFHLSDEDDESSLGSAEAT